jgi:hypothetical protein
VYVRDFSDALTASLGATRVAPWRTLERLFVQTPLLIALMLAAAARTISNWRRQAPGWRRPSPELPILAVTVAALLVDPFPYPYNLLNVVPFLFLFCYRFAIAILSELPPTRAVVTVAIVVLGSAQLLPFTLVTRRHFVMSNARQKDVMRAAEALTDASSDPVYDGIGMVPTRRAVHRLWFLHSINVEKFSNGVNESVHEMLAANPAPVVIQSYRTDWLPRVDRDFIRSRYLPLSDDLWVLGTTLNGTSGEFQVFRSGRYLVDNSADAAAVTRVDGATVKRTVVLSQGRHAFACEPGCALRVQWVGPTLQSMPALSGRDHASLFVNWY